MLIRPFFDSVRAVWRASPRLRRALMLLLVTELTAMFVLPALLAPHWYLRRYLNDERAVAAVTSFFADAGYLQPDAVTGWHNRPNIRVNYWTTDEFGGRSHAPVHLERSTKARVLFLGSSKVNGGTSVQSDETISAYLANDKVETLNFGTMLYGVDQSYLAYKHRYFRFNPDVVVLGLDTSPEEALGNIYIPLRRRSEVLMPYVKARFQLRDDALQVVEPPLQLLRDSNTSAEQLLEFLSDRDDFFFAFENFRRFDFTPLSYLVERTGNKIRKLQMYVQKEATSQEQLLLALLMQFRRELDAENKQLVLLLLPDHETVAANHNWSPDLYRHLRLCALLQRSGFEFVDMRAAMKARRHELFHADGVHYTAEGNQIAATELSQYLAGHGSVAMRAAFTSSDFADRE